MKAKIIEVQRVDKTVNVVVEFSDINSGDVNLKAGFKQVLNFNDPAVTYSYVESEIIRIGKDYKNAISSTADLIIKAGTEIDI